jgi:endonuclease G, mitochondrial
MRMLILLLVLSLNTLAQDTITIVHKAYKTTYDKNKNYPVKVEWWITKNSLVCDNKVKRGDKFIPDPKLIKETNLQGSYTGAGFDRGHNFPAADAACDQVANEESFYFSNMTAQYPALNRGDWKALESLTRELSIKNDSVKVWCGSTGEVKKIGIVSVPEKCWKVIYVSKTKEWFAYLFTNNTSKADGIENNLVTVNDIEKLTKFKFELH